MTRAVVALGSNVGDRIGHLRAAVSDIRGLGTVISVSSLYETEPVGGPPQDRFLNAVLVVDTDLGPAELLGALHQIEDARGRTRREQWGPRTLDLDLIAHGGSSIDGDDVTVPHPRAHRRRFVLAPLVEIAPRTLLADGAPAEAPREGIGDQKVFRWRGEWLEATPGIGWMGGALVLGQMVLIAVAALAAFLTVSAPIAAWRVAVAAILALAGSYLVVGATFVLGDTLSALPDPRPGGSLRDRGPYRLVRHPIYGGILIGGVGMSVMAGSAWPLPVLVALAGLLRFKSGLEERALGLAYPDYAEYRTRVRRRFIPLVW